MNSQQEGFAVSRSSQILPKDVYNKDCPFFHPEHTINQHLEDEQEITVELYDRMPVDKYGAPIMSKWSIITFFMSKAWRKERATLVEEKMLELEEVRRRKEEEENMARLNREQPRIMEMREIMKEQLHDKSAIEETMAVEWNLISGSGVLEKMGVHDETEQNCVRDFFRQYYTELSDLYKFYSAINSGGGTHTLEYIEFSKFLCETNIFQADESSVTLKIFVESHIISEDKARSSANIHTEIHKYEFFVSLIKIGIYKYVTLAKKRAALLRKKGHNRSHSKTSTPSHSQALEMLYDEYLQPVIDKLQLGSTMKASLGSDEVLLLLHEHLNDLSATFCNYAEFSDVTETDVTSLAPHGMVDIKLFTAFATDTGFLGSDITVKDIRQIFAASQHDSFSNSDEIELVERGGGHDSHQEQMVFAEFLEAIARLGVLKWCRGDASTQLKSIRRAVQNCLLLGNSQGRK